MQAATGAAPTGPSLNVNMTLDEALASYISASEPLAVTDGDGQVVGTVDPNDLAAAVRVDPA